MKLIAKKINFLLMIFFITFFNAEMLYAEEALADLKFQIKVVENASRFIDLLQYPSYLAVALENSGIRATNAGRVILVDRENLQFRNVSVRFLEKKGLSYKYTTHIQWDLSMTQLTLDIPFEIDLRKLDEKIVEVKFYTKGSALLPDALVQKMQMKIQAIASQEAQNAIINYLQKIASKNKRGIDGMLESILIDSYNLPVVSSGDGRKEFGDAEPLKDQYYLLATIVLWFLLLPITIGLLWWKKQRKLRG